MNDIFRWSFDQPILTNGQYADIAKNFLEKYVIVNLLGISFIDNFYDSQALCTIHLHQGDKNQIFELVGYIALRDKLRELGIVLIRYHHLIFTSQPVGKHKVLIVFHGQLEINGRNFNTVSTMILKAESSLIINQVIEIFL